MKNLLFTIYLFTFFSTIFGAASSSSASGETSLNVRQLDSLDEGMVDIALEHLPAKAKDLEQVIAARKLTSRLMLFVGPPGVGKTVSARSIGQRYYGRRAYFFKATDLAGDKYQNSGITALNKALQPIMHGAKQHQHYVTIDEVGALVAKGKGSSSERDSSVSHFWLLLDEIKRVGNIVLVFTCNDLKKFPRPLLSRIPELCRYEFKQTPLRLYQRVFQFYLNKSSSPHVFSNESELFDLVSHFDGELRAVESVVSYADEFAFIRSAKAKESCVITQADIAKAIRTERDVRKKKSIDWEEFFSNHEKKIQIAGVVAGVGVATATGLYHYVSCKRQEERQIEWRQEDLARQEELRKEDLARQELMRQEDIARQEEQFEQTQKLAEMQMAQQEDFDNRRRAKEAMYTCCKDDYNVEDPEIQEMADEMMARRDAHRVCGIIPDLSKKGAAIVAAQRAASAYQAGFFSCCTIS